MNHSSETNAFFGEQQQRPDERVEHEEKQSPLFQQLMKEELDDLDAAESKPGYQNKLNRLNSIFGHVFEIFNSIYWAADQSARDDKSKKRTPAHLQKELQDYINTITDVVAKIDMDYPTMGDMKKTGYKIDIPMYSYITNGRYEEPINDKLKGLFAKKDPSLNYKTDKRYWERLLKWKKIFENTTPPMIPMLREQLLFIKSGLSALVADINTNKYSDFKAFLESNGSHHLKEKRIGEDEKNNLTNCKGIFDSFGIAYGYIKRAEDAQQVKNRQRQGAGAGSETQTETFDSVKEWLSSDYMRRVLPDFEKFEVTKECLATCDTNEILARLKSGYRKLAKEKHPDSGGTNEDFKEMHNIYDALTVTAKSKPAGKKQ